MTQPLRGFQWGGDPGEGGGLRSEWGWPDVPWPRVPFLAAIPVLAASPEEKAPQEVWAEESRLMQSPKQEQARK